MGRQRQQPTSNHERLKYFRIECIRRSITSTSIAKKLKVTREAIYQVVSGRARSRRIEAEIAKLFPALVQLFPFEPAARITDSPSQRNCAEGQEGKRVDPPTPARKKSTQRRKR